MLGHASDTPLQEVEVGTYRLPGFLAFPAGASAAIVFAHGSGSSRFSERNLQVARRLNEAGFVTLLFDLLRPGEEIANNRAQVFDIGLLAGRLADAIHWLDAKLPAGTPIGLFGASTGAAAALVTSVVFPDKVTAVVSRGGRPDMARAVLDRVKAPTLLIVGGEDRGVIELNEYALSHLKGVARLAIVPGAGHLFAEAGAMEEVTRLATDWFEQYLTPSPS